MNHRDVQIVEPGFLRIEQRICVPFREVGTDAPGPGCVYALVHVKRGTVAYLRGATQIPAGRRFALFLPPFAIVQALLERCEVDSVAWVFLPPADAALPPGPALFATRDDWQPHSAANALDRLRTIGTATDVGRAHNPPPIAAKAKEIIDCEYETTLEIGALAAGFQVAPAVLSRAFKKGFGVPPVRYRHHIRVVDALTRLASGAVPVEVFQDVGFNDLSRFYKIFRKLACAAPGAYRWRRSRNAKT
jgi:AraC-like DNA-binding protein